MAIQCIQMYQVSNRWRNWTIQLIVLKMTLNELIQIDIGMNVQFHQDFKVPN